MTTGQRRDYVRDGADIYRRSFAIIRAEADLGRFSPAEEPVAVRIIHASGMVEVADDIVMTPDFAETELAALRAGVPTAYDAALTTYLGEVDRRGPALEGAYQATVNDGLRGIFWVDAGASAPGLALLGLLAWTSRRRRAGRG